MKLKVLPQVCPGLWRKMLRGERTRWRERRPFQGEMARQVEQRLMKGGDAGFELGSREWAREGPSHSTEEQGLRGTQSFLSSQKPPGDPSWRGTRDSAIWKGRQVGNGRP